MKKVTDMIDTEIAKIQYGKVQPITNNQIDLIFETMEKIDPDLKPLNVILS